VLGICGGLQMLGGEIADPDGVEGAATGLGLLGVRTTLAADKATRHTRARFAAPAEPWAALGGLTVDGYEIRHGRTVSTGAAPVLTDGLGFAAGPYLGVYLHGLFEDAGFTDAVLGRVPERSLDDALDDLADAVGAHLDIDALLKEVAR
jgi:adenosylcobyric acid synthase